MPGCEVQDVQRTVLFLAHPELWPVWPFMPVVRRRSEQQEYGVVVDARGALQRTGFSATVFRTNLFTLPETLRGLLDLPKEVFDSVDEVADAGWRVD